MEFDVTNYIQCCLIIFLLLNECLKQLVPRFAWEGAHPPRHGLVAMQSVHILQCAPQMNHLPPPLLCTTIQLCLLFSLTA